jgi:hypothetical protein
MNIVLVVKGVTTKLEVSTPSRARMTSRSVTRRSKLAPAASMGSSVSALVASPATR